MNKFYQLVENKEKRTAKLDIYGNIRSYRMPKSENSYYDGSTGVNSYDLKKEIDALDVDQIDVYINSNGGEVAEALSIYNTLQRHSAKVITHVDGIAASAASIVFMAGDVRSVGDVGLLMIHNCMTGTFGANSAELRKLAEDNDKWNQQSIDVYVAKTGQTEKQVKKWMDNETYFTVKEMLKYGFATEKETASEEASTTQDAFTSMQSLIMTGVAFRDTITNAILYGTKETEETEESGSRALHPSLVEDVFNQTFLTKNFAGAEPDPADITAWKDSKPADMRLEPFEQVGVVQEHETVEPEPKKPRNLLTGLFTALSN